MRPVSRNVVDLAATGHTCTAFIGCVATQFSVKANNISILRPGDPTLPHTILKPPHCVPHPAKVNMGSFTVFAENLPVARMGDSTDFGKLVMGSHNVFAGG
tara:strand:+ start:232 stop:534 length:303 start_codon:yes stop_codon:yes gene_type:complete